MNWQQLPNYVMAFLSSPMLFLVVIAIAIAWQQSNSKKLAIAAGQDHKQAQKFSWIVSASIFICVGNNLKYVAWSGAIIESIINTFRVFKTRAELSKALKIIDVKLEGNEDKDKKGKENEKLLSEKVEINEKLSILSTVINVFIGFLMPSVILVMSEQYINSGD